MRYLLDTHIVIWAMVGSEKLSGRVRAILQDSGNEFFVSSASLWEVAIKHHARPLDVPVTVEQMIRFCRSSGIAELPIRFKHSRRVSVLPDIHHDPFDRMLIAQAMAEDVKLISHDDKVSRYGDVVIPV